MLFPSLAGYLQDVRTDLGKPICRGPRSAPARNLPALNIGPEPARNPLRYVQSLHYSLSLSLYPPISLSLVANTLLINSCTAGDSAQCISQDSTFRFANLKALFFNHFSGHHSTTIDPSAAKATRFTLSHNFRSHQGILRLASWVMDKLWRGFPDCVDKLPPEIGTHMGPKPVLISMPFCASP